MAHFSDSRWLLYPGTIYHVLSRGGGRKPESRRQIEIQSIGEFADTVSVHESEVALLKLIPLHEQ